MYTKQEIIIDSFRQGKRQQLIPTSEMFNVFITIILGNDSIEPVPVKKGYELSKNEFVLMHCKSIRICKGRNRNPFF